LSFAFSPRVLQELSHPADLLKHLPGTALQPLKLGMARIQGQAFFSRPQAGFMISLLISSPGLAQQLLQVLSPVYLLFSLQFEISSLRIFRIKLQYAGGSFNDLGKILGLPLLPSAFQQNLNLAPCFQNASRALA